MTRAELLQSSDYWTAHIQVALYSCVERFMSDNGMNRTQLAEHLGVSKGYISQLLNGDYDHKISKLVDLALKCGYVPKLEFESLEDYIKEDAYSRFGLPTERKYLSDAVRKDITIDTETAYEQAQNVKYEKAA